LPHAAKLLQAALCEKRLAERIRIVSERHHASCRPI
jgi:hypothetical protein